VNKGIPEETHPPKHQPGANGGGHQSGKDSSPQGSLLKAEFKGS